MYLLTPYPEGFKSLDLPENMPYDEYDCVSWAGRSKLDNWKAPVLEWLEDEFTVESDQVGDFVAFGGGPIAISDRAYQVLKDLLNGQVEFLPTKGPGPTDNWKLLNVTNVIDIMDTSKSKFDIYSDGKIGRCTHAYLNETEPHNKIYRVKGKPALEFINGEVKSVIESAGLTGGLIREYLNPA